MTVRELYGKLRYVNRKIRVVAGPHGIFGLYLKEPRHPDANPISGLRHIGGITAPNGFCGTAPRKRTVNAWGVDCRGYLDTLKLLHDHGHARSSDLNAAFGTDWRYV